MTVLPWQFVVLLVSAALTTALSLVVWRRREISAAMPFFFVLVMAAAWCLISAADIATASLVEKIWLLKLRFCFLPFLPMLLLETVHRYARGRKLFTGWKLAAGLLIPVITAILALTADSHSHFRTGFMVVHGASFPTLAYTEGPWIYVHYAYTFIVEFWALCIMINLIRRSPGWARPVNIILVFVGAIPAVVDYLFWFGISPTPWFNYTPLFFVVTGALIVWAFFGYRLLELAPVARSVLVERLKDVLIVFDAEDRVVDLNAAACKALGVKFDNALGRPASELLKGKPEVLALFSTHQPVDNLEIRFSGDSGGTTHECSILNVPEEEADPRARILLMRDIVERKSAERDLREARDAAQAADKAKSQFLATMSHEIRTPMNGVIGFLDLLKGTSLSEEQKDFVDLISNSSESLLVIINDILDYSKIEAGHLAMETKPFALRELLQRISDLYYPGAKLKGIGFELQMADSVPETLCGDSVRLGQILNNLLSNAVKFTGHGQVTFSAEFREKDSSLVFSVRDTGIGISAGQKEQLFKPFSQADGSITRKYGGTGLGLIISQTLCEMMGGRITVDSLQDQGSVFTCIIPIRMENGVAQIIPRIS